MASYIYRLIAKFLILEAMLLGAGWFVAVNTPSLAAVVVGGYAVITAGLFAIAYIVGATILVIRRKRRTSANEYSTLGSGPDSRRTTFVKDIYYFDGLILPLGIAIVSLRELFRAIYFPSVYRSYRSDFLMGIFAPQYVVALVISLIVWIIAVVLFRRSDQLNRGKTVVALVGAAILGLMPFEAVIVIAFWALFAFILVL